MNSSYTIKQSTLNEVTPLIFQKVKMIVHHSIKSYSCINSTILRNVWFCKYDFDSCKLLRK